MLTKRLIKKLLADYDKKVDKQTPPNPEVERLRHSDLLQYLQQVDDIDSHLCEIHCDVVLYEQFLQDEKRLQAKECTSRRMLAKDARFFIETTKKNQITALPAFKSVASAWEKPYR